LDFAAAYCGEEAGLPIKTVQSYFEVLEDTLIAQARIFEVVGVDIGVCIGRVLSHDIGV